MKCLICKTEIPDISHYCLYCGSRISENGQAGTTPAILQIARLPAFAGSGVRMKVFIDGNYAGELKNDSTESFKIPAGTHNILLTCGQAKSASTELSVAPGEAAGVVCVVAQGIWRNRISYKAFYGVPRS